MGLRRRMRLSLIAAFCILPAVAALSQTVPLPRGAERAPAAIAPLLGAWDLERVGASRKCTITLGFESAAHGLQVRFPATCRRALPVLDDVVAWTAAPAGLPRLDAASGRAVIMFEEKAGDPALIGVGPDGQSYRLDPKTYPRAARRLVQSPAERAATAAAQPVAVDGTRAPALETLPGRYVVMRQQNREACRIALNPPASAALDAGCQDTGLTIFDPAGWRYAGGRLTLTARKGHSVDLVFENGQWRKDPAVGAPLLLKKLVP